MLLVILTVPEDGATFEVDELETAGATPTEFPLDVDVLLDVQPARLLLLPVGVFVMEEALSSASEKSVFV